MQTRSPEGFILSSVRTQPLAKSPALCAFVHFNEEINTEKNGMIHL